MRVCHMFDSSSCNRVTKKPLCPWKIHIIWICCGYDSTLTDSIHHATHKNNYKSMILLNIYWILKFQRKEKQCHFLAKKMKAIQIYSNHWHFFFSSSVYMWMCVCVRAGHLFAFIHNFHSFALLCRRLSYNLFVYRYDSILAN